MASDRRPLWRLRALPAGAQPLGPRNKLDFGLTGRPAGSIARSDFVHRAAAVRAGLEAGGGPLGLAAAAAAAAKLGRRSHD